MSAKTIEHLLGFARNWELIGRQDVPYCRNILLDMNGLTEPEAGYSLFDPHEETPRDTATAYLEALCDDAAKSGLLSPDTAGNRALFSARLMGALTLPPSSIEARFDAMRARGGVMAATDWFYAYCRKNNYIQVDSIAKNVAFSSPSPVGELDITINLSKPEKDPRDIAAAGKQKASGYPPCLLCVENTGHPGNSARAARQNHRMLPITLAGQSWHMQYSPYLYYNEHCIALNDLHTPMRISEATFERLFDFVDIFPHYFIGSNADLPIVGGSILSHDHFQGGHYIFPMDKAPAKKSLPLVVPGIRAELSAWPMTCVRLYGADRDALRALGARLLSFWRGYSDESADILSRTTDAHNTVTPIARKNGCEYCLSLVLRNNRTSAEHPLGIFHPHAPLHHIKKENIGLIEVMGLFILPGRLKDELRILTDILSGSTPAKACPEAHVPWLNELSAKYGLMDGAAAEAAVRSELAVVCAQVLRDAGVFKTDGRGLAAFERFWAAFTRDMEI